MNEPKKYCGSGKAGKFEQVRIGLKYSDLVPNEKGFVNIILSKRKELGKFGETHTVYLDTWKPNSQTEQQVQATQTIVDTPGQDLPF